MIVLAWIGGTEILVAALVALILFGGRLPEVMKDFGRMYFRFRRSLDDLRRETGIDKTLRELEWEARDIARAAPKLDPPKLSPLAADLAEEAEAEADTGAETESPGEEQEAKPPPGP